MFSSVPRPCALWAVGCAFLALAPVALAGLIIQNDGSDLCNSNLRDCSSRCAAPQSFIFTCDSGGTFNAPQSDCKCTPAPPAGATTDGVGIFQLVQWPGPQACQDSTWLYDCAQYLNVQSMAGNMQGQAQDQASAMAAVTAAQTAAQAQAAANTAAQQQLAAMQQQQAAAGGSSAAGAAPAAGNAGSAAVPGLGAAAVPGLGGDGASSAPAAGSTGMAGPGVMTGQGMSTATGAGGGSGMMTSGAGSLGTSAGLGPPASSLMMGSPAAGSSLLGHRHLLQLGTLGAAPATTSTTSLPAALPTTQLAPACQKPIQGLVTGASAGVWVIPNYEGVASVTVRGNDTLIVQLGGQGSSCAGAYKLLSGQVLGLGQPVQSTTAQAKPATSAAASKMAGFLSIVAALSGVMLLWC